MGPVSSEGGGPMKEKSVYIVLQFDEGGDVYVDTVYEDFALATLISDLSDRPHKVIARAVCPYRIVEPDGRKVVMPPVEKTDESATDPDTSIINNQRFTPKERRLLFNGCNVSTIGDLAKLTRSQLLQVRGLGHATRRNIERVLLEYGYRLTRE